MKIEIQLGTPEEKETRKIEIEGFINIFGKKIIDKINLKKIIVSSDLEKTVNELEKDDKVYKAKRYMVECHAKIIYGKNNERYIVFSDFWNNSLDQNFRFFYFSHEIYHLVNDAIMPKIINDGTSRFQYLKLLEKIYDEYSANRFSIGLFRNSLYDNLKKCFETFYDGYFISLQNPDNFYKPLKEEILKFRFRDINVDEFLDRSLVYIEPLYTYLSYIFAFKDSLKFIKEKFDKANKDFFINKNTHNLFKKLKTWYENKNTFNFEDGLEEIKEFFSCLSISFEDTPDGRLYVNVLDI